MALRPTIHKLSLDVSDLDRAYYASHALTIARHPSETDERMMIRVLAFALFADDTLGFGGGISDSDEPDLWARDLTGTIRLWIEIGQPDARLIRKASHRALQVVVLTYGKGVEPWWNRTAPELNGLSNVRVLLVTAAESAALAARASRNMALQVLVQDGMVTISDSTTNVEISPTQIFGSEGSS